MSHLFSLFKQNPYGSEMRTSTRPISAKPLVASFFRLILMAVIVGVFYVFRQ